MSHPAICIALQGKTSHVPPRYIHCDLAGIIPKSVSGSCNLMVRYSGFSIRHTEFGIRKSRIGNRGTGKSPCHERLPLDEEDHGAVGWAA
jgi:hypothetical protein